MDSSLVPTPQASECVVEAFVDAISRLLQLHVCHGAANKVVVYLNGRGASIVFSCFSNASKEPPSSECATSRVTGTWVPTLTYVPGSQPFLVDSTMHSLARIPVPEKPSTGFVEYMKSYSLTLVLGAFRPSETVDFTFITGSREENVQLRPWTGERHAQPMWRGPILTTRFAGVLVGISRGGVDVEWASRDELPLVAKEVTVILSSDAITTSSESVPQLHKGKMAPFLDSTEMEVTAALGDILKTLEGEDEPMDAALKQFNTWSTPRRPVATRDGGPVLPKRYQ